MINNENFNQNMLNNIIFACLSGDDDNNVLYEKRFNPKEPQSNTIT